MGRNNIQNNTKTQNTQNIKRNIKKNKETNIKRIIKKHKTISYNISKSKEWVLFYCFVFLLVIIFISYSLIRIVSGLFV